MNTKTSLLATAATVALFGAANGQVIIDITGSTAGRSTVNTTIKNLLSGESTAWYRVDGQATSEGSADAVIYKGGTLGGVPVTVRTFWAGSATGVDYVSNQVQLNNKFIATTVTASNAQLSGTQAALATGGSLAPASADTVSEFGFSDVKQAATTHQSNPLAEQTDIFVIPFVWLKTADLADVTNITDQQARSFFTAGGEFKKSYFSGNALDTSLVYAVGRDSDSGTRITALAETGAGVFTPLTQWGFTTAGSQPNITISAPTELGDGGYASGGSVGTILSGTGFQAIGYVGMSDAANATGANGAVQLTFNGVAYSADAVKNGTYTFWSTYQAIRKQTLGPEAQSLFNSLKTALIGLSTGSSSIKLSEMNVTRAADGADVLPK